MPAILPESQASKGPKKRGKPFQLGHLSGKGAGTATRAGAVVLRACRVVNAGWPGNLRAPGGGAGGGAVRVLSERDVRAGQRGRDWPLPRLPHSLLRYSGSRSCKTATHPSCKSLFHMNFYFITLI
ncbi:hypothetical protein CBM2637_B140107 [Cupriavidus taiwanensis]|nr:hypothetical protein CBM2637_B140107 [Cupriavidus taiwanensis]